MWRRWFQNIDVMWLQVGSFVAVMFFIFFADAVLSDFVPGFMQNILGGNALVMGIVMSTSSIAGLVIDFMFARLFRNQPIKNMIWIALVGASAFAGLLLIAMRYPWVLFLVLAMVVWGIYYEMFGFSSQRFVVGIAPPNQRTAVWSVLDTMMCLAYALGPLLAQWLASRGDTVVVLSAFGVIVLGLLIFLTVKLRSQPVNMEMTEEVTARREFGHWKELFVHVWPIITMGIMGSFVDAVFWTTGTVVNDQLARNSPLGSFFLTAYMASSLLVGFILGRIQIVKGKKKLAQILLLFSGLTYASITVIHAVWWYILVVFVASFISALAWPLMNAVYTDLLARMGRKNIHMMGLRSSTNSIAYIIGPIAAGWLVTLVGELPSFAVLGWIVATTSLILLFFTPRKLRLPQTEIADWE